MGAWPVQPRPRDNAIVHATASSSSSTACHPAFVGPREPPIRPVASTSSPLPPDKQDDASCRRGCQRLYYCAAICYDYIRPRLFHVSSTSCVSLMHIRPSSVTHSSNVSSGSGSHRPDVHQWFQELSRLPGIEALLPSFRKSRRQVLPHICHESDEGLVHASTPGAHARHTELDRASSEDRDHWVRSAVDRPMGMDRTSMLPEERTVLTPSDALHFFQ